MVALALIPAEPGGAQGQHRTQTLASGRNEMSGELGDEPDRALHPLQYQGVHGLHVLAHESDQAVQAWSRRSAMLLQAHHYSHCRAPLAKAAILRVEHRL